MEVKVPKLQATQVVGLGGGIAAVAYGVKNDWPWYAIVTVGVMFCVYVMFEKMLAWKRPTS